MLDISESHVTLKTCSTLGLNDVQQKIVCQTTICRSNTLCHEQAKCAYVCFDMHPLPCLWAGEELIDSALGLIPGAFLFYLLV
jgi:hypothetical protein